MSRVRSYAPGFIKQIVWNWKHRRSAIHPEGCPHDLLKHLRTLECSARVLDLGCGPGNLRAALRLCGWRGHFIGVNVPSRPLSDSRQSEDNKAEWHLSAIEDFPILNEKVSAICLCESIYYVRVGLVPACQRCRQSLISPRGRIIIRIWHTARHREYIALLSDLGFESALPIYTLYT